MKKMFKKFKKEKRKVFKILTIFSASVLILNMSLAGVFFATEPVQADIGEITISNIDNLGEGNFQINGTWVPQGGQCWTPGGEGNFHYQIRVTDNGTALQPNPMVNPAACNEDFTSPVDSGDRNLGGNWPASGQGDAIFSLEPGTHEICAVLIHVNNNGNDIGQTTTCWQEEIIVPPTESECGNNIWEEGELCDNGGANIDNADPVWSFNQGEGDRSYCSTSCDIYYVPGLWCGDGSQNGQEECDGTDGVTEGYSCSEECTLVQDSFECRIDLDVMIVMDTSGSMDFDEPTRLSQAQSAANNFIANLGAGDQSGLVSFAGEPNPAPDAILVKTLSNNHSSTQSSISGLTALGGTNIGDGINLANLELTSGNANPEATKIEILLTDGRANLPNGPGYGENAADVAYAEAKALEAAGSGIKIFTIGLGGDINETMLQNIADASGGEYHFAPTGGELDAIFNQIAFEICEFGSISGCKYNDPDGDGYLTDETTIPGWLIQLRDDEEEIISTQLTNDNGCYTFSGLTDGDYIVTEAPVEGWQQTYPEYGSYEIEISDYSVVTNIDFGNYFAECGNYILDDGELCDDGNTDNGDGCSSVCTIEEPICEGSIYGYKYDWSSEDKLGGWEIVLRDVTGAPVASTTTSAEEFNLGYYEFTDLCTGAYDVSEVMQSNWEAMNPQSGSHQIEFASGQDVGADFWNRYIEIPSYDLHGYKWNDENGDGELSCPYLIALEEPIVGQCEPKLPGWTIFIDDNENQQLDEGERSTVTSSEEGENYGWYWFNDLPAGDYSVCEVNQTGWNQTYPLQPICHTVTLPSDEPLTQNAVLAPEYNFGNYYAGYCGDQIVNNEEQCDGSAGEIPSGYHCTSQCTLEQDSSGGGGGGGGGGGSVPLCIFDNSCDKPAPVVLGEAGAPILVIVKTVEPSVVNPGDTVEFKITVTNNGNLTAFDVILSDVLPPGLSYASEVDWALGDIAPGETKGVKYLALVAETAEAKNYVSPVQADASNYGSITAQADLDVVKVTVLGAELPATGFNFTELSQLIIAFSLTLGLAQILKRKEEALVAD